MLPNAVVAQGGTLRFTEVSEAAGARLEHAFKGPVSESRMVSGGVAAGDYDDDGWIDLYVVRGNGYPNALLRNRGDGTFEDVAVAAGVAMSDLTSGPSFFDFDGDGRVDLLVGGLENTQPVLFRNTNGEEFENITEDSHIFGSYNSVGHAVGDFDHDGDLDVFVARWGTPMDAGLEDPDDGHLFENMGNGTFRRIPDALSGLSLFRNDHFFTFAPNFADINNDGWDDVLVTSDFKTSRVFLNQRDGTFADATDTDVITDENGMGSAIADYDGDGDLDWFVTSIFDPDHNPDVPWGTTGNRLYRNRGDGSFEDVTEEAGVRNGYWGWGACFADFDNDGNLDIFHVNGFDPSPNDESPGDPSRLFRSNGDGTFTEMSAEAGIEDRGQGRGVVCFDYDHDGDVDVFISNNRQMTRLYRNDSTPQRHFLNVTLRGDSPNTQGIGAKITVEAGDFTQVQHMRLHCNYVSHQPAELHFGLGQRRHIDRITVEWPDGNTDVYHDLEPDQFLTFVPGDIESPPPAPCLEGAESMCLEGGRFEVTAIYETPDGGLGPAMATQLFPQGGYFWFFDDHNMEVVVKVVDACAFGGHYWVFAAGLTNLHVDLRIRDTLSGALKSYTNHLGAPFVPVQDTGLFKCSP